MTQTAPMNRSDDLAEAQRVLRNEAEALLKLAAELGDSFTQAVECLYKLEGRVIVTGMGKSGHIAHKIAATLASTGTPAFFVHPAEASHGDLGMVSKTDAVIALSNSGETQELSDFIAFTRRHRIPLIGITSKAKSTLAQASDMPLILAQVDEACPLGLAPTTSTTMMMALGDALATSILKRRGFTPADFRSLHPGGQLGQRLLKVENLMHQGDKIPQVRTGTVMKAAIIEMSTKGFGCVAITDEQGDLKGIITDGDLRRHLSGEMLDKPVDDIMSTNPSNIYGHVLAQEALARMNEKAITSLFVVEEGSNPKVVGILHIHDCLRIGLS